MIALQRKERPMIFSGSSVRGILADRKWATRRELKPRALQLINWGAEAQECNYLPSDGPIHPNDASYYAQFCPYGQVGDLLWVREAWAETYVTQAPGEKWVVYRECDNRTDYGGPWKPSIHMRRRDSRILLEITDVRVERLQSISEEQAEAEGCAPAWLDADDNETVHFAAQPTYRQGFARLWRDIHGAGSWEANPMVWVIEFRRIQP